MKRINTTKIMAVLASLCLVTSSFVGSTLAKYITTANSNDAARVAKFGVVLQADGNLFGADYIDNIEVGKDATGLAVQSHYDMMDPVSDPEVYDDVVAPGTKNDDGLHFSVTGKPEVATKLTAVIKTDRLRYGPTTAGHAPENLAGKAINVLVKVPVTADNFSAADRYYKEGTDFIYSPTYIEGKEWYSRTDYDLNEEYNDGIEDARLGWDGYLPVVYKTADYNPGYANPHLYDTVNEIAALFANNFANKKSDGTKIVSDAPQGKVTIDKSENNGDTVTYTIEAEYPPNFDYSDLGMDDVNLTWEWEFERTSNAVKMNIFDTYLGYLASKDSLPANAVLAFGAGEADERGYSSVIPDELYNLKTGFGIEITVTQLDGVAQDLSVTP